MLYRSKVKATSEEIALIKQVMDTPLIALQCGPVKSPLERCHALALSHGLKEQTGFYGLDLETGEFVSRFPIVEEA